MIDALGVLAEALEEACDAAPGTDWNRREGIGYEVLCRSLSCGRAELFRSDVYLGGDVLRPYLAARANNEVWLIARERHDLSCPRLLTEVDAGEFGVVKRTVLRRPTSEYVARSLSAGTHIDKRLLVPNVYLVSLTNGSRYQARRYPLNVARLAQWLRFQHAGRVRVVDLPLDFGGDLYALSNDILAFEPRVLGISLNFGELDSLRSLVGSIRDTGTRPILCLGNVLAAWVPDAIKEVCSEFRVFTCPSYGETYLEELCLSAGQAGEESELGTTRGRERAVTGPPAIVSPDERLLMETFRQRGQASIETSFGCQYSRCTFCPRDHRGRGWRRPAEDSTAVVDLMASLVAVRGGTNSGVLSIVDEDAFGEEGRDPNSGEPSIVRLIRVAGSHRIRCEIYTRLEQIFDRRWKKSDSVERLKQLADIKGALARVFVGVESGSNSQLRRYGKGQTTQDVVDALRAGSLLGLPLEFGFITFDPLLTPSELVETLEFLARTDVLLTPDSEQDEEVIYSSIVSNATSAVQRGDPVFSRVAYMATELELFAKSPFLRLLSRAHPELVGEYDSTFARYDYSYEDPMVGHVAAWCRVWTEATFRPVYRLRLAGRTLNGLASPYQNVIRRYREATFALLLALTGRFVPAFKPRLREFVGANGVAPLLDSEPGEMSVGELQQLWAWVLSTSVVGGSMDEVDFRLTSLKKRRES